MAKNRKSLKNRGVTSPLHDFEVNRGSRLQRPGDWIARMIDSIGGTDKLQGAHKFHRPITVLDQSTMTEAFLRPLSPSSHPSLSEHPEGSTCVGLFGRVAYGKFINSDLPFLSFVNSMTHKTMPLPPEFSVINALDPESTDASVIDYCLRIPRLYARRFDPRYSSSALTWEQAQAELERSKMRLPQSESYSRFIQSLEGKLEILHSSADTELIQSVLAEVDAGIETLRTRVIQSIDPSERDDMWKVTK